MPLAHLGMMLGSHRQSKDRHTDRQIVAIIIIDYPDPPGNDAGLALLHPEVVEAHPGGELGQGDQHHQRHHTRQAGPRGHDLCKLDQSFNKI